MGDDCWGPTPEQARAHAEAWARSGQTPTRRPLGGHVPSPQPVRGPGDGVRSAEPVAGERGPGLAWSAGYVLGTVIGRVVRRAYGCAEGGWRRRFLL